MIFYQKKEKLQEKLKKNGIFQEIYPIFIVSLKYSLWEIENSFLLKKEQKSYL
jgi:hypothetical protein